MANLIFYVMAVGAVLFAAGVVAFRTPIASVISLLGSFFCLATIYLVSGFPFLAAIQILVYAGAILVLFLFVIMLLNLADATDLPRLDRRLIEHRRLGLTAAVSLALLGVGLLAANTTELREVDPALVGRSIDAINEPGGLAEAMFTDYLLPFEATSLLLLATAVAVLVLAKRQRGPGGGTGGAAAATGARPAPRAADGDTLTPAPPPAREAPAEELVPTGGPR